MDRVALAPGSRFEAQRARNRDYLLAMNATDLMCEYTSAANLTGTFANPTCIKKDENGYWGHYMGHYVSATAQLCNATGDAAVCARNAEVVARLAEAQAAWVATGLPEYAGGFLFPYSYVAWANLFGPPSRNCDPVCVPYYVFHKMLAGMLDSHTLAGSAQALQVALGMAAWVKRTVEAVLAAPNGQSDWQDVLSTEWGGMNDALFNLAAITGDVQWLTTAYYFNHWSWSAPLAVGSDDLPGNHANTHIPEIIGDARGYELTGDATKLAIVTNFFEFQTQHHAFATGNGNDGEHWGDADKMGDQLNSDTEESCTTYNLIKVSRHLFTQTLSPAMLDHYERALFNGLIGNQATTGPDFGPQSDTTGFIYMLPLGGGGLTKPWGASDEGLPCCWGTLSETFAKISDSIFYESADAATLYIGLFASATATWRAGAVVQQESGFPYASRATTSLTVVAAGASPTFTLALRVPAWATSSAANSVTVNGVPVAQPITPGAFLLLARTWVDGDVVVALFPPSLKFEQLNDARPNFAGVGAILYGAMMLASVNTSSDAFPLPDASSAGLAKAFTRVPTAPPAGEDYSDLVFRASSNGCGNATFIPLADVTFERYAAYQHTATGGPANSVGYNASGASVLDGSGSGFITGGGAALTPNGGDENIRSGDPGDHSTAAYATQLLDATHVVTGISLTYQYVAGYGGDGAPGGTTFDIVAIAAGACGAGGDGPVLATLYSSPVLSHYPFDVCNTCYSPPVDVIVPRGSISLNVSAGVAIVMRFTDNSRNIQLKLPIAATVFW
jgi:DUF1680 family protein